MGNCIEVWSAAQVQGQERREDYRRSGILRNIKEKDYELVKNKSSSNGMRVKMVVTKEELQWLMLELNSKSSSEASGKKSNNKRVKMLLGEIGKRRKRAAEAQAAAWKPSLHSITEDA